MSKQYSVRAGEFAIVDKEVYEQMLKSLHDLIDVNGMEVTAENVKFISEKHNAAKSVITRAITGL